MKLIEKIADAKYKAEPQNVWKPLEEALKNAGFSISDINEISKYQDSRVKQYR